MIVALVAAVARGGVIGRDGGLPWRLPEDMARFREVTLGHPVVMGRRTWESLPEHFRPLPGRRNVVLTRKVEWEAEGAERAESLEAALALLAGEDRVSVIGGSEIFAEALPVADELVLTELDLETEGDTFFPAWDRKAFVEVAREDHVAADGTPFAFVTYARTTPRQLAALAEVVALLESADVEHWLFGGWAVDFYAGQVTRAHDDVDLAVWLQDLDRIAALLEQSGWIHAPEPGEDGGTGYERERIRLELTYLVRDETGRVFTPLRDVDATWPDGAFGADAGELCGVRARLVALDSLRTGKSSPRDDPGDAAKDRADAGILRDI